MKEKVESGNILKVEHLCMFFDGMRAVEDLSFEIKRGEIFGLIGPNGAGKTTVFHCITRFYKPTSGRVWFYDEGGNAIDLTRIRVHDIPPLGVVRTFQNIEVIPELTVLENLLIAAHRKYRSGIIAQMFHLPKLLREEERMKAEAEEVLRFMGISDYKNRCAASLPYVVLKKLEIARTLMNRPRLIILDEPAAGLNGEEREEIANIILSIRDTYGCAVFLVEHDMSLVLKICSKIMAISFGRFLAVGSAEEIQSSKDVQKAYLGEPSEMTAI